MLGVDALDGQDVQAGGRLPGKTIADFFGRQFGIQLQLGDFLLADDFRTA